MGVSLKMTKQLKQNTRFRECYPSFGCETKTGVVRILVIFQDGHMLSRII